MAGEKIALNKRAAEQNFRARFVCLTGKKLSGGRHPIRLQLIHNLKVKRYPTGVSCTLEQWDKEEGRVKAGVKGRAQANAILDRYSTQTIAVVDALVVNGALSLDNFHARYTKPKAGEEVVANMMDLTVVYRTNKQNGTAACFRDAASALDRFTGGKPITFAGLTATKLEEFERYLRDEGCTNGGIGVYMRMIRIAVNRAIKAGLMDKEQYPFDTVRTAGYSMKRLKSTFSPRALSEADMNKVKAFPFEEHPELADTVRLFLFSYFARGMNFRDMALMKPASIIEGRLKYTRMKTKAKGKAANFDIEVTPPMAAIMDYFHDPESPWTFPILRAHHTEENAIWKRTKDALRLANRHLKRVAEVLDIKGEFTFYVARHTYAMNRKRNGIPIGKLSESMGHASEAITHAYLKSFSNEELDAANRGL
jgi:integrase